jgi:hypothetical protein
VDIVTKDYTFPSHFPEDCPPKPYQENRGTYYRLVADKDKSNPVHFKSYHELGRMKHLEKTDACGRRAVSVLALYHEVVALSINFQNLGKYVATLELKGGHGVIHNDVDNGEYQSHHNWWIPLGVNAAAYCTKIRECQY